MDLYTILLGTSSQKEKRILATQIGASKEVFDDLIQYFMEEDIHLVQKAFTVANFCVESHPKLLLPYMDEIVTHLLKPKSNTVKRNILRMFQFVAVPEEYWGEVYDVCIKCISNANEPSANQAFSISIALNIVKEVPELGKELQLLIEERMEYSLPAFRARGKKALKELTKIEV